MCFYFFCDMLIYGDTENSNKKLMEGKALRKHSLHEKTAASVLLKLPSLGLLGY